MYDQDIDDLADMVIAKKRLSAKARKRAKIAAAAAVVGAVGGLGATTRVTRTVGPSGMKTTSVTVGRKGRLISYDRTKYPEKMGGVSSLGVGRRKSDGLSSLSMYSERHNLASSNPSFYRRRKVDVRAGKRNWIYDRQKSTRDGRWESKLPS